MDQLQIASYTGGIQLRWEVRGHEDDANKIKISDDGLELQMAGALTNEVEYLASEPIHGNPGDLFYVEFEVISKGWERWYSPFQITYMSHLFLGLEYTTGPPAHSKRRVGCNLSPILLSNNLTCVFTPEWKSMRGKLIKIKYSTETVVGLGGYIGHGTLFCTIDGAWVGECEIEAHPDRDVRPYVATTSIPSTHEQHRLRINLMQTKERFLFDIDGYHTRNVTARTLRQRGLARLPPELVSMIVSHIISVAQDESPKRGSYCVQCALVCRDWSKVFRRMLLEEIHIHRASHLKLLSDIFVHSPTVEHHGGAFVHTLRVNTSSSHPSPLELILSSPLPRKFVNLSKLGSDGPIGAHAISPEIPPRVPPRIQLALPALLRPLRTLTHLRISTTTFRSLAHFFGVIHAIPSLSNLDLDDVAFSHRGPVRRAFITDISSRLRQLNFQTARNTSRISAAADLALKLHILQLADVSEDDTTAVIGIIQALLRLYGDPSYPEHAQEDLSAWFELSVRKYDESILRLVLNVESKWMEFADIELEFSWVSPTHAALISCKITLREEFRPAPLPDTRRFQVLLTRLDDLLSQLGGLSRGRATLVVLGRYEPWVPDIADALPTLMPKMHRKRLISVEAASQAEE